MRRAVLAAVFSLASANLVACGGRRSESTDDAGTTRDTEVAPVVAACTVEPPVFAPRPEVAPLIGVTGGPNGPRAIGQNGWWDAVGDGVLNLEPGAAIAWVGDGYLVAGERSIIRFEPDLRARRTVRAMPPHACDVQLVAAPGGAAMLYRRIATGACRDDVSAGVAMFQRLTSAGALDGPAVQLGLESGVPWTGAVGSPVLALSRGEVPDLTAVVALSARESGGRIVANLATNTFDATVVLLPDGHEIAREVGGDVACPRPGCIRLGGRGRGVVGAAQGGESLLAVESLNRSVSFQLPIDAVASVPLAVHGDRVLVRLRLDSGIAGDGDYLPDLALVDVARREPVPVRRSGQAPGPAVTSWRQSELHGTAFAARTREGFVLAAEDPNRRPFWVRIACTP